MPTYATSQMIEKQLANLCNKPKERDNTWPTYVTSQRRYREQRPTFATRQMIYREMQTDVTSQRRDRDKHGQFM